MISGILTHRCVATTLCLWKNCEIVCLNQVIRDFFVMNWTPCSLYSFVNLLWYHWKTKVTLVSFSFHLRGQFLITLSLLKEKAWTTHAIGHKLASLIVNWHRRLLRSRLFHKLALRHKGRSSKRLEALYRTGYWFPFGHFDVADALLKLSVLGGI